MAEGYISDFDESDTVMDKPHATMTIDLGELPPQQAAALVQMAGKVDEVGGRALGCAIQGDEDAMEGHAIDFHFALGEAMTLLEQCGAIEAQQPVEDEE